MQRRVVKGWRARLLPALSIGNALAVALVWLSNRFVSEDAWCPMLLAYVPQPIYALPVLVVLLWATIARRWKIAGVQLALLVISVFGLMGLSFHSNSQGSKDSLRLMTFNVQLMHKGTDNVLALIRQSNPDIFCLQECNSAPERPIVHQVRAALPAYEIAYAHGLIIGTRLPLVSSKVVRLDPGRPMLEAVVRFRERDITIANVHLIPIFIDRYLLDSPGIIPDHLRIAGAERDIQLKLLLDYAATQSQPLVLSGDFNAPAGAGFHRKLSKKLTDAFASVGSGFGYTIPARFPLMRLDFVYVSHDLGVQGCFVSDRVASDHRAVIADLAVSRD
jgi:endonuclease/exonuclease/phosphatase (EEP) superfamily protein YafD